MALGTSRKRSPRAIWRSRTERSKSSPSWQKTQVATYLGATRPLRVQHCTPGTARESGTSRRHDNACLSLLGRNIEGTSRIGDVVLEVPARLDIRAGSLASRSEMTKDMGIHIHVDMDVKVRLTVNLN